MSAFLRDEEGIALAAVLWTVAALALIAAAIVTTSSYSLKVTRRAWEATQERELAQAAFSRALLGVTDPDPAARYPTDASVRAFDFDGVHIQVAVQDERGKLDLNEVDADTLERLFRVVGLQPADATALASRIVDWRSKDASEHLEGASVDDYRRAGLAYLPRKGPFQSVEELELVMGVSPAVYAKVAPDLTVYSHEPYANLETAPKAVLMAQNNIGADAADKLIAQRTAFAQSQFAKGVSPVPAPGDALTITAAFEIGGRAVTASEVAELTGDTQTPVLVLAQH